MSTLTESTHAGEYILSEANGERSRAAVIVASGNDLSAGAVLGVVTASGKFAEHDAGAADGTENAVAILFGAVDASAADADGAATVRDSEVDDGLLAWPAGISAGDKADAITSLAGQGIIVRGA